MKLGIFDVLTVVAFAGVLVLAGVLIFAPPSAAPSVASEDVAKVEGKLAKVGNNTEFALATSAVLMMKHHEREIEEALEEGDLEEVEEEAEEILEFLREVDWPKSMVPSVNDANSACTNIIERAKANDLNGTRTAFKEVASTFKEVHHELHHILEEEH